MAAHARLMVWFDFCFTAFQHILGHFGHGQLPWSHCSLASLLGSLPVLSAHSFASNWLLLFLNQQKRENGRRKFFTTSLHERMCRTWGWKSGPLACQADMLPIELLHPVHTHLKNQFTEDKKNYNLTRRLIWSCWVFFSMTFLAYSWTCSS